MSFFRVKKEAGVFLSQTVATTNQLLGSFSIQSVDIYIRFGTHKIVTQKHC